MGEGGGRGAFLFENPPLDGILTFHHVPFIIVITILNCRRTCIQIKLLKEP